MLKYKSHLLAITALLFFLSAEAQITYFPDRQANWEEKSATSFGINAIALKDAVDFALANDYSGSRDLRLAIL